MVVCKYFQQGSCRFGQSCRFEHVYGSKYSYHASAPAAPATAQSGLTDEQLVAQVQSDIQPAIKGKQWLLSVYAPFKDKSIPGLSDLSPEEARLFIYEAKANNTLPQAAAFFSNLMQDARTKYEQLLQPTPELIKLLRNLYQGKSAAQSPFSNVQQTNTGFGNANNGSASSIFRSAAQSNSIFGSNTQNSIFGTKPASNNVFNTAQPENAAAKSIFAQASQNVFGNTHQTANVTNPSQSIFAAPNSAPFGQQTPFGNTQVQQASNVFQTQQPTQNAFAQNTSVFGQPNANQVTSIFSQTPVQPSTNVFGQQTPTSTFGQAIPNVQQQVGGDTGVYSQIEDLSPEDLQAFQSKDFKLGFLPESPPPHSLCF